MSVQAYSLPGDAPVGSAVPSDGSGNYTISGLAAGSYAVGFKAPFFTDQYYNNQPTLAAATPVTVTSGATTTGINATLQTPGPHCGGGTGSISGQVTSGVTGKPLAGVAVQISAACGGSPVNATTDASGDYTAAGVTAGSGYQVYFSGGGCCYAPQYYNGASSTSTATSVTVTANQTTSAINAAMQIDPQFTITGTITDARTGAPVPGAQAIALKPGGGFNEGIADANGMYGVNLGGVPGTYTVEFAGPNGSSYATQFYNNKTTAATADPVTVRSGQLTEGINAALGPEGAISGTVTNAATGAPAAGIHVVASFSGGGVAPNPPQATTDSRGHYTVPASAGPYSVAFTDPTGKLAAQYYGGSVNTSSIVSVSNGQTTTANTSLRLAGGISGTVTLPAATPSNPGTGYSVSVVGNGQVLANQSGLPVVYQQESGGSGVAYKIVGLMPGVSYTLEFRHLYRGLTPLTLYYCEATTVAAATPLSVTAGKDLSGIDEVFPSAGHQPPACPASTPTLAQIGSALAKSLTVHGPAARIAAILKSGGYRVAVSALEAGKLTVAWYYVPAGAHLARAAKPTLVVSGSHAFSRAGVATIKLRLTAKGRALLRKAKRVKLTAVGTFAPKHGKRVSQRRSITLKKS